MSLSSGTHILDAISVPDVLAISALNEIVILFAVFTVFAIIFSEGLAGLEHGGVADAHTRAQHAVRAIIIRLGATNVHLEGA